MLFRTIFNITPRLTHLTLNDLHPALIPACLSNVDVLLELRVVSLHEDASIDLDVLRKLSAMDSLEEVSFAVDLNEPVDFSGFSALKKLEMNPLLPRAPLPPLLNGLGVAGAPISILPPPMTLSLRNALSWDRRVNIPSGETIPLGSSSSTVPRS